MRSTDAAEIHSKVYSTRVKAVEALRDVALGAKDGAKRLYATADNLREASTQYGIAPNSKVYRAYADLVQIVGLAAEWRAHVLDAGADAGRFLTASKARAVSWLETYKADDSLIALAAVAGQVETTQNISDVATLATKLATTPIPVGLYGELERSFTRGSDEGDAQDKAQQLTIAFVKFTVDGTPLEHIHFLSPGELHDLDIEVRVSRWPAGATALVIEPITVEQSSTYQMPVFSIAAPEGSGPFQLQQKGRARLAVPHHMNARPFEFKYAAKFEPSSVEQPVDVVGQRTLLLEGIDLARNPITGYPNLDRKLMEIRDSLRLTPGLAQDEVVDALALAAPLANFAGQAVQDNLFNDAISEVEFQKRVKSFLRTHPKIGSSLEEHPRAGGGITDLSYKGIRLELKSEQHQLLSLKDCQQFVGQAATYAVASGKRIAVLCVLDCSKKEQAPFPVQDGFGILMQQNGQSVTFVVTALIQGNLAMPSSLSRG